jgi:hypothetical protein
MNARRPDLDLDALARLPSRALADLYAAGTVPTDLHTLDGHPRGRMLAVRGLDQTLRGPLARLAASSAFVWGGKSFRAVSTSEGRGINRVHLGGRHALFPFLTRFGPSVVDGAPCVVLDYDQPDNPGLIRQIHDEVRQVQPGLFLGPAMWKRAEGPAHVLWFALDTRVPAEALCLP